MDLRQFPQWGNYLSQIGWKVEKINNSQAFIRPIPLLGGSVIKIQRPKNPLSFTSIDELAKKYRAVTVIIEPDLENYQATNFNRHGFKTNSKMSLSETATIKIDLTQTTDMLWKSFSENARRNIKKAQANKLSVKAVPLAKTSDEDFELFFQFFSNLAKNKKFFIPPIEEFQKKRQAFNQSSYFFWAYQNNNNTPLAVIWVGVYKDTAVYMHVGITDQGYQLLANYLLVWESLQFCQALGLKEYDFEGIFDPRFPKLRPKWASFTEFKKRFHGRVIEYPPPCIKCYNIFFRLIYLLANWF